MESAKSPIWALCLAAVTTVSAALVVPRCGSSNSPSTPTTAPAPTSPTPTPAAVETLWIWAPRNLGTGYLADERIVVNVRWTGCVFVAGTPRLILDIGGEERIARFTEQPEADTVQFAYQVDHTDHDGDGISISTDAIDTSTGRITSCQSELPAKTHLGGNGISNDHTRRVRDFSSGTVASLRVDRVYFSGGPLNPPSGYLDGESIDIYVHWTGDIEVLGFPTLRISIGDEERLAAFNFATGDAALFTYLVRYDDHDSNGTSIPDEDAIELNDGTIVSYDGQVPVNTSLSGHTLRDDRQHKVRAATPFADVRDCSIERREARRYGAVTVDEWDGTPFRVDIIRNFPAFVTDDDLEELLDPIDTLADSIEDQLGYRIIEKGDVIPVPAGTPPNWNKSYHGYEANAELLPRERGQLLAFYMDDDSNFWDHRGGAPQVAFPWAGTTSYNKRTMGKWWRDEDTCCVHRWRANGREGHALVHEVAHLLGFKHPDDPAPVGVLMAWGSLMAPWLSGSGVHFFAEKDIEVLKCIFPQR